MQTKFKVGQRVYGIRQGLGRIISINPNAEFPIEVKFYNKAIASVICFTLAGHESYDDLNPSLLSLDQARLRHYDVPLEPRRFEFTAFLGENQSEFSLATFALDKVFGHNVSQLRTQPDVLNRETFKKVSRWKITMIEITEEHHERSS